MHSLEQYSCCRWLFSVVESRVGQRQPRFAILAYDYLGSKQWGWANSSLICPFHFGIFLRTFCVQTTSLCTCIYIFDSAQCIKRGIVFLISCPRLAKLMVSASCTCARAHVGTT
eukprot:jgi/Botrbrau1/8863/Bobra.50_2s0020.1